jgi:hypothetical protein
VIVKDTTPPVLHEVPVSTTLETENTAGEVVTYRTPTATDLVDGTDPVTCSPESGATFPIGTTTVTCTATDKAGLSAKASFTVTVKEKVVSSSPEAAIRKLLEEVQSSAVPQRIRATLADVLIKAVRGLRNHRTASHDLAQFVRTIERDQRSGRPQIPAALANAWIQTAKAIEGSLGHKSPGGRPRGPGHHHSRNGKKKSARHGKGKSRRRGARPRHSRET